MCLRPQCERHSVAKPLCVSSLRCYKKGGGLKTLSAEQSCLLDQPVETQACRGRDRAQGSSIVRRERTNSRGKTTSSQTGLPSNKCPTQGFQAVACFEDPERCPRTLLSPYLAPTSGHTSALNPQTFSRRPASRSLDGLTTRHPELARGPLQRCPSRDGEVETGSHPSPGKGFRPEAASMLQGGWQGLRAVLPAL